MNEDEEKQLPSLFIQALLFSIAVIITLCVVAAILSLAVMIKWLVALL